MYVQFLLMCWGTYELNFMIIQYRIWYIFTSIRYYNRSYYYSQLFAAILVKRLHNLLPKCLCWVHTIIHLWLWSPGKPTNNANNNVKVWEHCKRSISGAMEGIALWSHSLQLYLHSCHSRPMGLLAFPQTYQAPFASGLCTCCSPSARNTLPSATQHIPSVQNYSTTSTICTCWPFSLFFSSIAFTAF